MSVAVLCPGQGMQHDAMLDAAGRSSEGRGVLEAIEAALGEAPSAWLAPARRFSNAVAQPLLAASSLAAWAGLRSRMPAPAFVAGYSAGELVAHGIAGALDAVSVVRLACMRAASMDAAMGARVGGLVAMRGLRRAAIDALCARHDAHVAIVNGRDAFIVGGLAERLATLAADAQAAGAQATVLPVDVPSHTPLLAAAVAPWTAALEAAPFGVSTTPVIAGVDASRVVDRARALATLAVQVAQTIEWSRCMDALVERGCRVFLEVGPGQSLSRLMRERHASVEARGIDEFGSLEAAARWAGRPRSA